MPEFQGTQFSKLVLDPISQRLLPQFRAPWAKRHKKDALGQWGVIIDMPTHPLNTSHITPDILHQMYLHILWWAADLPATPQQRFPAGSPSHVKVQRVQAEQAPRVLEASTLSLCEEDMVGQILDLVSPPWAPASVLVLHLVCGLRHPMASCIPRELLRTPRVQALPGGLDCARGPRRTRPSLQP